MTQQKKQKNMKWRNKEKKIWNDATKRNGKYKRRKKNEKYEMTQLKKQKTWNDANEVTK